MGQQKLRPSQGRTRPCSCLISIIAQFHEYGCYVGSLMKRNRNGFKTLSKERLCSLSNYTKGALLYGVIPRMCAHLRPKSRRNAAVGLRNASLRLGVRGRTPRTPECPGRFASLRSEQGAAPLAPRKRLSLQTWSAETVLQTIPADQVFIS